MIGSPICSVFSQLWGNLFKVEEKEVEKVKEYGRMCLDFCIELYTIQVKTECTSCMATLGRFRIENLTQREKC
jgi:hypothetical protein